MVVIFWMCFDCECIIIYNTLVHLVSEEKLAADILIRIFDASCGHINNVTNTSSQLNGIYRRLIDHTSIFFVISYLPYFTSNICCPSFPLIRVIDVVKYSWTIRCSCMLIYFM
jgi:hypothetical protein